MLMPVRQTWLKIKQTYAGGGAGCVICDPCSLSDGDLFLLNFSVDKIRDCRGCTCTLKGRLCRVNWNVRKNNYFEFMYKGELGIFGDIFIVINIFVSIRMRKNLNNFIYQKEV